MDITLHCNYIIGIASRSHHILVSHTLRYVSALNGFENSADCLQFGFVAMEFRPMTENQGMLALRTGVLRTGRGRSVYVSESTPFLTESPHNAVDTTSNGSLSEFIFIYI